ncbi:hypothetical protein V490_05715 [Pseudogymnoascus sp. VKM F-3557]|nr:hypothetical protein V490_05715 [Pseudogymnoascus sp. VKM F-3557]
MSNNRARKEDMWAQSSTTTEPPHTPTSPQKSTPATSPAKSTDGSSIATNDGTNSTKVTITPTSLASRSHSDSGTASPDAGDLPEMPNVSRASEYEDGFQTEGEGTSFLSVGNQAHADALIRALSQISLHGDTTPRALKTPSFTTTD